MEPPQSFDDMFRVHYARLVALGVVMTGSDDTARELAQETMLRAHQHWAELSTYEHVSAWLRRVMTNLFIDHYRKRRSEQGAYSRLRSPSGLSADPDVLEQAAWTSMIAPLSGPQRAVVALHYGEDMSVEQIATVLHMSAGTVKSSLSRARDRIAAVIAEETRNDRGA